MQILTFLFSFVPDFLYFSYEWYVIPGELREIPKVSGGMLRKTNTEDPIFVSNEYTITVQDILEVLDLEEYLDFELLLYIQDVQDSVAEDSKTVYVSEESRYPDKKGNILIPKDYVLEQNYPNPFNPVTTIRFSIPKMVPVRLTVYDITGREVARLIDEVLNAGYHTIQWNASGVPSGIYIYIT